ncbi:MAG: ERCC4 domain-containing protein, partial [Thermoplasmatales archaeon]
MIIIDSREPKRMIDELKKLPESEYRIETLAYGDYIIMGKTGKFVIERKDVFDLIKSVTDGRLWEQLKGMEKYKEYRRIIIIEGNIMRAVKILNYNLARYIGVETSIVFGWDISLVHTGGYKETVMFIEQLNRKVGRDNVDVNEIKSTITKEKRDINQELLDVLLAISGIGGKKAKLLLDKYKTLYNIVNAP